MDIAQLGSTGLRMKIRIRYIEKVRKGCFMSGGSIGWLSHGVKGF